MCQSNASIVCSLQYVMLDAGMFLDSVSSSSSSFLSFSSFVFDALGLRPGR